MKVDIKEILLLNNDENDTYDELYAQAKIGYILSNYLNMQEALSIDLFSFNGDHYHVGESLSKNAINELTIERLRQETLLSDKASYWSGIIHNYYISSNVEYIVSRCSLITDIDPITLEVKEIGFLILSYDVHDFSQFDATNQK